MLKPNSTVTNNLIKARELIADEKNWCTFDYHRGRQYCAVGALAHVRGTHAADQSVYRGRDYWLLAEASEKHFKRHPEAVNDQFGHAAVMRMFDRAIELSLQEPTPTPAD